MIHVLILDDDPLFGRTLTDSLHRSTEPRFSVIATASADDAFRTVREASQPFDAYLIDQRLGPGPDGIDVMQELMRLGPGAGAIIFTGLDDPDSGIRAYQAGAYRYLPKPFQTRELIWILRSMQEWRTTLNEHDWLRALNDVAELAQRALSMKEVADIIVQGGLKLGFERARLWLMLDDNQVMRGMSQAGNNGIENFTHLLMPITASLYNSRVLQQREPMFFHGRELGQGFLDQTGRAAGFQPPLGEWANIPLWAGERSLGSLALDNFTRPLDLSADKRRFLKLFGSQTAAALERARLFEQETRRSQELAVLNEIGRHVTAIDDLDLLLEEVRNKVGYLMDVSNFMIVLLDEDATRLEFRLLYENGKPRLPRWLPLHTGLAGHIIAENKQLLLPNGSKEYRREHNIKLQGRPAKCWLGVPLRVSDKVVGAVAVQSYDREHAYSLEDQRLLSAVADQIAGAIQTVHLKDNEARTAGQLKVLHQASEQIMKLAEENLEWLWHATLTIATAQYGLSFNRAMLFMSEGNGRQLRGYLGIGHVDHGSARRDWQRDAHLGMTFETYLAQLRTDQLKHTPLESVVRSLTFDLDRESDVLVQALRTGHRLQKTADEVAGCLPAAFIEHFGATDYAIVPLRAGERVLGLVIVDNIHDAEPLWEPALNRLETFLAQVALVAENLRQRRAQEQLIKLNYTVLAESSAHSLTDVLRQVCDEAHSLSGADCIVIYPFKPGTMLYEYEEDTVVSVGRQAARTFVENPRPRGITGHIIRAGTLVVPDVALHTTRYDGRRLHDYAFLQEESVCAFVGTPILDITARNILGVMYFNYRTPRQFEPRDVHLVELFANLAAAAIRHGRATQKVQDGLKAAESRGEASENELRSLSNVLTEALTTTQEDKVVRTILMSVRELLEQPEVRMGVLLRDWESDLPDQEPREVRQQYFLNADATLSTQKETSIYRGITGLALKTGTTQLAVDVKHPEWADAYIQRWPTTRSELDVPIKLGKETIGVINIESPYPGAFSELHQLTVERLTSAAALALDNVRRQEHLRNVLSAAEAITAPTDLKDTLQTVVLVIRRTVPSLSCLTIWYKDPETDRVQLGEAFGVYNRHAMESMAPAEGSVVCEVMKRHEPIWAVVAADESQLTGRFVKKEGIVSSAAFPMWADNDSVGAMFFNYRRPHEFSAEENTLFPILTAIVAASVRDSTRLKTAQNAWKRLDVAFAITQAVGTSLELNMALRNILATLCRLFEGATPCVLTYNETSQMLEFQPASREFYYIDNLQLRDLAGVSLHGLSIASSVARRSLESRQVEIENVGDVDADERYFRLVSVAKSELCISLMSTTKELLGVLALERPKPAAFDEEDVILMKSVAQQISMAVERVRQSEQLQFKGTVATATAWAADIAHEINREVGLIRNWVGAIQRTPDLSDAALSLVKKIDTSADRLAGTLRGNILSKSSVAKEFEIDIMLHQHVSELIEMAPYPATVEFKLNCTGQLVRVSPAVLERVLRHLVRNALEAMADFSDARLIVHTNRYRERWIEVKIEDVGPGVRDNVRPTLFQLPSTEGRGYGLLFVRSAVEDMGGKVWHEPRSAGSGALFSFTVPFVEPQAQSEV